MTKILGQLLEKVENNLIIHIKYSIIKMRKIISIPKCILGIKGGLA